MLGMDEFKIQDLFVQSMLRVSKDVDTLRKPVYKPYFDWKEGKTDTISRKEAYAIMDTVANDLWLMYEKYPDAPIKAIQLPIWGPYEGYGKDKFLVGCLEHIDAEIINFIMR